MPAKNAAASLIVKPTTSAIDRPPTLRPSDSGRRREPWQAGHGRSAMNGSISRRMSSESVSRYRRSRTATTPSKPPSASPWRMTSRTDFFSDFHVVSSVNLYRLARAASVCLKYGDSCPAHGASAPCLSVRSTFGTTRSGSTSHRLPRPEHVSHAPYGLLKENMRGETSGSEIPQSGQARRSENVMGSGVARSVADRADGEGLGGGETPPPNSLTGGRVPLDCFAGGTILLDSLTGGRVPLPPDPPICVVVLLPSASPSGSTWTTPSARRRAVSSESASRLPTFSRTTSRSTRTSIVCLRFLSRSISSLSSRTTPFTRTRE